MGLSLHGLSLHGPPDDATWPTVFHYNFLTQYNMDFPNGFRSFKLVGLTKEKAASLVACYCDFWKCMKLVHSSDHYSCYKCQHEGGCGAELLWSSSNNCVSLQQLNDHMHRPKMHERNYVVSAGR